MAASLSAYSSRLGRQQLVLWGFVLAVAFFTVGFSTGRSSIAPRLDYLLRSRSASGRPPPSALLEALSLQPSAGAAALPASYRNASNRRAARLLPDQLGAWREYAAAR